MVRPSWSAQRRALVEILGERSPAAARARRSNAMDVYGETVAAGLRSRNGRVSRY